MKIHTQIFLFTTLDMRRLKKYVTINGVNPLYLIINKVNGYFEEKIKKYEELWSKIRDLIRSMTKNSDDFHKKYMKIKFNLGGKFPLNKMVEIPSMFSFS